MNKTVKITMLLVATLVAANFGHVEPRRRRHRRHHRRRHRRHHYGHHRYYGFGYPYSGYYRSPFGISLSLGTPYRRIRRWEDYRYDIERLYKNDRSLEKAIKQQQDALKKFAEDSKNLVKDVKNLIEENKHMQEDIKRLITEVEKLKKGKRPKALLR